MNVLHAKYPLGEIVPNISSMLSRNAMRFQDKVVFESADDLGIYHPVSWAKLYSDINAIAYNLSQMGFERGDKMILFSPNRLEMLELELSVMASGGIVVPIFAHFKRETAELLIKHSDARWLAVAGQSQMDNVGGDLDLKKIFYFDPVLDDRYDNLIPFAELLRNTHSAHPSLNDELLSDTICLNMYTSGTMGTPKCVQLTHRNILSQQAAINQVWDINEEDRFLSYLPWHHSFGGIFELFTALYNGAQYYLEPSLGRDVKSIFRNWRQVRPTVFFSVPKVYRGLVDMTRSSAEFEGMFFNPGLKFVFTAAAALPDNLSAEFEHRKIPVIEGWGLTETSPCCTLTDPSLKREPGVVGLPIPGVSIRISDDDEIQVKGPNVMTGYYKNDSANDQAFTEDGWYRTGDVGELTSTGLKLISRKDRIFKLSNGEKVVPTDLERIITRKCHYVQHVVVAGTGQDHPVALIFPNKNLLKNPDYELTPEEGCFCPRNLNELGRCLQGCLHDANKDLHQKFAKIKSAAVIDSTLSIENNMLTPSMKVSPNSVIEKYKAHLLNMYGEEVPSEEEVYMIELEVQKTKASV